MRNLRIFFLAVLFLFGSLAYSQIQTSHNERFNLTYTTGPTYNIDDKEGDFHYRNIDAGFNIQNHEFGICIGENNDFWYGGYYKFHFQNIIMIGYKLGKISQTSNNDIYNEIIIAKDFPVTNDLSVRANLFFSTNSENPLFIKNTQKRIGFLFGLNYYL